MNKIIEPCRNCQICDKLVKFRNENKEKFPTFFNAPVPCFGEITSEFLVLGLAPGLQGANQTGRPFTKDYAGLVLYPALKKFGFAKGEYKEHKNDGFELLNCRITNSVKCVPPQNKVTTEEVKNCSKFLISELENMPNLKVVLTLGLVAHNALLSVLGYKKSEYKFSHGMIHRLEKHNIIMLNSYHTSRYNINTNRLTYKMFDEIIEKAKSLL